ncbi:periplasmic chaperone for outer membrane proteins SurA [Rhodobacter aestuarii]|uniref:Parvulin-like PPIase n=2 Tax=Rhodobacter aestuarii TaxID=453582 RepID=A0A1N7M684_9RHOB|nr:periplasmic chaperone for outer membrane proteins SurA [Rhodobacter aestuarii]SIS81646.1 periplasmic chaperone for outer membrane proteins SurA [Rhodobacter aestuarii]
MGRHGSADAKCAAATTHDEWKTERMKRHFSLLLAPLLALSLVTGAAPMAQAQSSQFAPVIRVNNLGITGYEIAQRTRFMELLGAKGDIRKQAEDALIEDRLRMWKARADGISLAPGAVQQGMSEFAARANLTAEEFVKALGEAGVDAQTYRDFVAAGMIWREVVKAHFAGRIQATDADVARALALETPKAEMTQVLLSEVIVRVGGGGEAEAMAKARRASAARTEAEFAEVAREISSSTSSRKGGQLDWMPIEGLPAEVRGAVMNLRPGRTTAPLSMPNAVAVFFMRGIDEGGDVAPGEQAVGYATLLLGATGAEETASLAAKVAADANTCDDLYSVARDLPAERLERVEGARRGELPADVAAAVSRLDAGETKVLRRGPNDVLVMLCDRGRAINTALGETGPSTDAVRNQIVNQRVAVMADALLDELKAEAVIVRP